MENIIDDGYRQFATVRQLEYLDAIEKHGSITQAAKQLNVNRKCIQTAIQSIKQKAALQGYSPEHDMTHIVPSPFELKGTSTLFKDGKPVPTLTAITN